MVQYPTQSNCVARQAFLLGCSVHGGGGAEEVSFEVEVAVELATWYLLSTLALAYVGEFGGEGVG